MIKLLQMILFVLLVQIVNAQTSDWQSFEEDNYSIQYPSQWEFQNDGYMGTKFILFSPQDSETDVFKENINLVVQSVAGYNLDLAAFVELSVGQIETMITDAKMLVNEPFKNELGAYQKMIYTGTQGNYKLQFEQHAYIIDEVAYIVTFTSEQNQFDAYQERAEQIMNTFRVK